MSRRNLHPSRKKKDAPIAHPTTSIVPVDSETRRERSRPNLAASSPHNENAREMKLLDADKYYAQEAGPLKQSHGHPSVGTSGAVNPVTPIVFEPKLRPTLSELKLLFRNRKAETFVPNEQQVRSEENDGSLTRDKSLVGLPTHLRMIRNKERTGFFTRLNIQNISQYFLTFRVRASVGDRYFLTPPVGCIERGGEAGVYIETDPHVAFSPMDALRFHEDTFLVDIVPLTVPFANLPSLYVFWKMRSKHSSPYRHLVKTLFPVIHSAENPSRTTVHTTKFTCEDALHKDGFEKQMFWQKRWFKIMLQTLGISAILGYCFSSKLDFSPSHDTYFPHLNLYYI